MRSQSIQMKLKRVLPPTYFFISIIAMALFHFLAPLSRPVSYPWSLFGLVPLVAGIALNLLADAAFKEAQTTVKPFEVSAVLITTGVFHLCRHPMYLGMTLILLGIAVFMGSLTPFIIIVIFTFLMEFVFVRTEEEMLQQQFGTAWNAYKDKARKWI